MMEFLSAIGAFVRGIPAFVLDPYTNEVARNIGLVLLCCFPLALFWQIAEITRKRSIPGQRLKPARRARTRNRREPAKTTRAYRYRTGKRRQKA